MDAKPEPLTITEADVGRIVYAEATDLIHDEMAPVTTLEDVDTAAVILQDEDTRRLGMVFLRWPWGDGSLRVSRIDGRRVYATQAEAVMAGALLEREGHDRWRQRIEELEALVMPADTTPVRE